jgi:hypothetical protein
LRRIGDRPITVRVPKRAYPMAKSSRKARMAALARVVPATSPLRAS